MEEEDVWHKVEVDVEYSPSKDAFIEQVAACIRERRYGEAAELYEKIAQRLSPEHAKLAYSRKQN